MTAYEKCRLLQHELLHCSAEVINHPHWTNDYIISYIRDIPFTNIEVINIAELTSKQMDILGFGKWKESSYFLVPLWFYQWLPEGLELVSIDGVKHVFKKYYTSMDNRQGYMGYLIQPKDE